MKKKKITEEAQPPRLKQYEALIFITGAVTLSLEVLASRIMTPYFGVSLYIWAGILSITLIFLALGYQLGGQISQRREKDSLTVIPAVRPAVGGAVHRRGRRHLPGGVSLAVHHQFDSGQFFGRHHPVGPRLWSCFRP